MVSSVFRWCGLRKSREKPAISRQEMALETAALSTDYGLFSFFLDPRQLRDDSCAGFLYVSNQGKAQVGVKAHSCVKSLAFDRLTDTYSNKMRPRKSYPELQQFSNQGSKCRSNNYKNCHLDGWAIPSLYQWPWLKPRPCWLTDETC